jgi:hypothetical protein
MVSAVLAVVVTASVVFVAAARPAAQPPLGDVVTQHVDRARTGANLGELLLTPSAVRARGLTGVERPVDGAIESQPLFMRAVPVNGVPRDLVFITTTQNSVWAFDAKDRRSPAGPVWCRTLMDAGAGADVACSSALANAAAATSEPTHGSVGDPCASAAAPVAGKRYARGIYSTPVIDTRAGRRGMYVVYSTTNDPCWTSSSALDEVARLANVEVRYYVVKLDLRDGAPIAGPVQIAAAFKRGDGVQIPFDAKQQLDRPGLLLDHGGLYMAFGMRAAEESADYHGWLLRYDADTLRLTGAFNTSPYAYDWPAGRTVPDWNTESKCFMPKDSRHLGWEAGPKNWFTTQQGGKVLRCVGQGAGIWQAGGGIAADRDGNVFVATGNGHYDPAQQTYGNSVLKLTSDVVGLHVAASFAPADHRDDIERWDVDIGSAGPMVLDAANTVVAGGKTGVLYALDRGSLAQRQSVVAGFNQYDPDQVKSDANRYRTWNFGPHFHGSPTFWHVARDFGYLYEWAEKDYMRRYHVDLHTGAIASPGLGQGYERRGTLLADGCTPPEWAPFQPGPRVTPAPGTTCAPMPGGMLALSANGRRADSAIVWAILRAHGSRGARVPDSVYGFDAGTLAQVFRSEIAGIPHFIGPAVGGGHVFVPTAKHTLMIFSLTMPGERAHRAQGMNAYDMEWEKLSGAASGGGGAAGYEADPMFRARQHESALVPPYGGLIPIVLEAQGNVTYRCDASADAGTPCIWTIADTTGTYRAADDATALRIGTASGTFSANALRSTHGDTLRLHVVRERPWPGAAPWQLLQVDGKAPAAFRDARFVQRIETMGGAPPQRTGQPGETSSSPVRALYRLLVPYTALPR